MKQSRIVVAGHLCLDMTPRFSGAPVAGISEILRPGKLVDMDQIVFSTGGTVSNTGIALRVFGCDVDYVARVGDDVIGGLILDELSRHGDTRGIRVATGEASSYTVVLAPPGIDRIFLHCPGTNDTFEAADIDCDLLRDAGVFHFGYPPLMRRMFENDGRELEEVFERAVETGVTTSLDMALPDPAAPAGRADWRSILSRTLPRVDIFLPSIEEAYYSLYPQEYLRLKSSLGGEDLTESIPPETFRRIAAEFLDMGCAMVALKAGHLGWYFRTADVVRLERAGRLGFAAREGWGAREVWCPAYQVDRVASATGSGDSSIAGFLTAVMRGHSLEDTLHLANCAGCHNLSSFDAVSGLPVWETVESDARGLELRTLDHLAGAGWRHHAAQGFWEI